MHIAEPVTERTFGGGIPLNTTGSNYVMSTWQSRDFKFRNFFSSTFIIPFIFEENPDGTLMLARHSNMLSFSSLQECSWQDLSNGVHHLSSLDTGCLVLSNTVGPVMLQVCP